MLTIVRILLGFCIMIHCTRIGNSLRCYECSTRIGYGDSDGCSDGKSWYLRRVECLGPSVCATYKLTSSSGGYPSTSVVNRGCQATKYGGTCEDIFNDLRRRGPVFPGHHECSTCTTDLCNSSMKLDLTSTFMIPFIFIHFLLFT